MGFWRDVRRGLRKRGVFLDAEQARLLLGLAREGARSRPSGKPHPIERDLLNRLEKRCREFD